MAYIRLPAGVKVALEYEVFGKIVVNVYHVTTTDPILTLKLFDIAEIFADWWETSLAAQMSNDIALTAVTAHNLDVVNGEKVTFPVSPPVPGGTVQDATTNNVALVASFRTDLTGRSFRGRAYHAGLPAAVIDENEVTVVKAANILASYVVLDTALVSDNCTQVVASFQSGGVPRSVGVATPVSSVIVNTRVDTQRRRLPKG